MSRLITRKHFLSFAALSGAAILLPHPQSLHSQQIQKPDPLSAELVKEFVISGHRDLTKVKELLEKQPGLLNAAWDWGGGDFETALEGAGHVGNKEIANFLLQKGARMNIFCAAMLGRLDLVKATIEAYPELKSSKGPHGLQLMHHAKKGGAEAEKVLAYLQSIGAA